MKEPTYLNVRLPKTLRQQVKSHAYKYGLTLQNYIIFLIEQDLKNINEGIISLPMSATQKKEIESI